MLSWLRSVADSAQAASAGLACQVASSYHFGTGGFPKDLVRAKKEYEQAVKGGNVNAMVLLGFLLEKGGEGVPRDIARAKSLYEMAADRGNEVAANNLGMMFYKGHEGGAAKDLPRAKALLERAVGLGNEKAGFNLAVLLDNGGEGIAKDSVRAKALYERAVEGGDGDAMVSLGSLLKTGREGVPKDIARAKTLYEMAAERGNRVATNNLGMMFYEGHEGVVARDVLRAKALLERAVDAGEENAVLNLAALLDKGGEGIAKDSVRAKALFERAVEGGDGDAMVLLGSLLKTGREGVPKDISRAKTLYEMAADRGNDVAINNLGVMFFEGHEGIVDRDLPRAKALLERAADAGHQNAIFSLAVLLEKGDEGVEPDQTRAKALYERSVKGGNVSAMVNLACLLERGGECFLADRKRAVDLYRQAASRGNETANEKLKSYSMETAFSLALDYPDVLDESFIVQFAHPEKVRSAEDLLAGHNMILLAIRIGVLTRLNIHTIGGHRGYLEGNLYLPARKLAKKNASLVETVLQHAENLGIIDSGCTKSVARDRHTDAVDEKKRTLGVVRVLATRISAVGSRASTSEGQAVASTDKIQELYRSFQTLLGGQGDPCGAPSSTVPSLTGDLTQLHISLRKQDRRLMLASLTRSLLSLILSVGDTDDSTTYMISTPRESRSVNSTTMKLAEGRNELKYAIDEPFVDLSNFQVAKCAFSEAALSKLENSTQEMIRSYIQRSAFKSTEELQKFLRLQAGRTAGTRPVISMQDLGSPEWISGESQTQASASSIPGPAETGENVCDDDLLEHKLFRSFTVEGRESTIEVAAAGTTINRLLVEEGLSEVSSEKLEELFFELADEEAEVVTEEVFVGMVRTLRQEQNRAGRHAKIEDECRVRFRKRSCSRSQLSIKLSARMLRNFLHDMEGQGMLRSLPEHTQDTAQLEQQLRMHDEDGDGYVHEGETMATLQKLMDADTV